VFKDLAEDLGASLFEASSWASRRCVPQVLAMDDTASDRNVLVFAVTACRRIETVFLSKSLLVSSADDALDLQDFV